MFPITWYRANGAEWTQEGIERPRYFDIGIIGYQGKVDDRTLSLIADVPSSGPAQGSHRLLDIAVVIRSKDAGINRRHVLCGHLQRHQNFRRQAEHFGLA